MRTRLLRALVAWMTLGSGIVNLSSVMGGPALPERARILREVFPLEFIHLSRTFTLLIGFALVVSSVNIYRRKKLAFRIVLALSAFSVIFHLTKGLDYAEAIISLALFLALLLTRRQFTVKSGIPEPHLAALRIGIALAVALGYGIAGFWFLDPRHFGIDFNIRDAIYRTWHFLLLEGDPGLVPRTRYARWFIESLYIMTVSGFVYAGFSLFRPVIYRFGTLPRERQLAAEILSQHGRSSLDYFKLWPDKSYFFTPSHRSFVAYRVSAGLAVVLSDPVGPEEEITAIIRDFDLFCRENGWALVFHQTLPNYLPDYLRAGFKKLKIGDCAIVDLEHFTIEGKDRRSFRSSFRKLESMGVKTMYYEPPISDELLAEVKEVSDEWLRIPGRRERGFTLGMFEPNYLRGTPLLALRASDGRMLAFVNIVPSYAPGEGAIDLMRRRIEAPNGVMDYLFIKLFSLLKEKGCKRFDLGMAPMSGFHEREEASPEERAIHNFMQNLNFLFSYKGLRNYKAKFASRWEPRYVIYRNALDLPRLALALRNLSEPQVHDEYWDEAA